MKKQIIAIACSFALVSGIPTQIQAAGVASHPNKEFTKFLKKDFVDTLDDSFLLMHQYLDNPEDYGIDVDKVEVSLGEVGITDEDREELKETEEELAKFDYSSLDKTQQEIYDEYIFENKLADETYDSKYQYLSSLWSSNSGLQTSLVSLFSDYVLYEESDIDDLITLIKDVPKYCEDAIQYSKTQAKNNDLMFDYDSVMESIQNQLDTKDDSAIYTELCTQVDQLNLDADKTSKYKEKIKKALDENFYPSFEYLKEELPKLKSSVRKMTGLANRENGKKYYSYLVKSATGTNKSVKKIKDELENEYDEALSALQYLYLTNDTIGETEPTTSFSSPEEIMTFLEAKYSTNFPEIEKVNYNIQALTDEQSVDGIVAYYVMPSIDNPQDNQIRYNKKDYGDDPSSLFFYQTFAHEGIAGHMYQAEYNREHNTYDIQYLMSDSSFMEGYATYVEEQALYYLDIDTDAIEYEIEYNHLEHALICLLDIEINYEGYTKKELKNKYSELLSEDGVESLYNQLCDNPSVFLSYYYGDFEIESLKEEAQEQLGKDFDEKEFHNALLEGGAVNYEIVERNINEYIQKQSSSEV